MAATLRTKILTSLAVASLVSIAVTAYVVNRFLVQQQRQYIETRLTVVSMMAHASLRNIMTGTHQSEVRDFILRFGSQPPLAGIRLIRPDGVVSLSNHPTEVGSSFPVEGGLQNIGELLHYNRLDPTGRRLVTSISPIHRLPSCAVCHPGPTPVMSYLSVDVSSDEAERSVSSAQNWMIGSSLFIIFIFVGTAFGVHFRFVKGRITRIAEGIAELEKGNFAARIRTSGHDELGQVVRHINRLGDRLELMRAELERSHRSELERAERMASVGELAASIAHEIRNPVAGISSAVQVLSAELPPGDEREAIFEEILRQTHRVNRAVTDLLSYARPSTPELIPASLNDPIRRALTLMEAQMNSVTVKLALEVEPNLPPVLLDSQQMQQVFVNLMMNALQAMPDGGTLTVRSGVEAEQVFVEIADSGPGIPKEILQDIFKPFFTTKHQGTGLGLSICRSIVENHCGAIQVKSEPDKGACFRIRLPIHRFNSEDDI